MTGETLVLCSDRIPPWVCLYLHYQIQETQFQNKYYYLETMTFFSILTSSIYPPGTKADWFWNDKPTHFWLIGVTDICLSITNRRMNGITSISLSRHICYKESQMIDWNFEPNALVLRPIIPAIMEVYRIQAVPWYNLEIWSSLISDYNNKTLAIFMIKT